MHPYRDPQPPRPLLPKKEGVCVCGTERCDYDDLHWQEAAYESEIAAKELPMEIHVTRVSGDGVYGHETKNCDPTKFAGDEVFFKDIKASDVERGNIYEVDDNGNVRLALPATLEAFRKPREAPAHDVSIELDVSMARFVLNTDAAADWVEENVPLESWQRLGYRSFAVDVRYAGDLAQGMMNDGLTVGDA